jgi:hypothetical protein
VPPVTRPSAAWRLLWQGALISRVAAAAIDMPGMPGDIEFPQNRYAGQPLVDAGRRVDLHAPLADLQWITDAT